VCVCVCVITIPLLIPFAIHKKQLTKVSRLYYVDTIGNIPLAQSAMRHSGDWEIRRVHLNMVCGLLFARLLEGISCLEVLYLVNSLYVDGPAGQWFLPVISNSWELFLRLDRLMVAINILVSRNPRPRLTVNKPTCGMTLPSFIKN
jgi:hypothetical protein